jgi:hypothetical protein
MMGKPLSAFMALFAPAVRPLERRPAVAFAVQAFTTIPHTCAIAPAADRIPLSHARFIQVFRDEVGQTLGRRWLKRVATTIRRISIATFSTLPE